MAEALDKDVSTHSPNSQSLQKILERLDSIEKQVQKQNTKPTYAQAAVAVRTVPSYPSIGLGREVEGGLVLAGEECQGVRRGLVECGGGDT